MANFINGADLVLYVWDGAAYRPIACAENHSITESNNLIETQTKCAPKVVVKDIGSENNELSVEGKYIDTTSVSGDTAKASHDYLRTLKLQKNTFRWDTGLTDKPFEYAIGIITELSVEASAADELVSFSATISVDGSILDVDPEAP